METSKGNKSQDDVVDKEADSGPWETGVLIPSSTMEAHSVIHVAVARESPASPNGIFLTLNDPGEPLFALSKM